MKKKSHLLKLLKMDLHRCIGAKRFPVIIALIVVLLIANVWESVMIELQYKMRMMGSLEKLMELLIFDRFKAAVIVLLSAVYTFGLCDDRNSSYDRLILFRCRPGEYLLSKLISNAIGVVSAVCISFVLFSIVLLPIMPLVGGDGMTQYFGYFACAMNFAGPLAYSILVGLLFGLFAVSVTSFGILAVSIFPNRYVGIAASCCILCDLCIYRKLSIFREFVVLKFRRTGVKSKRLCSELLLRDWNNDFILYGAMVLVFLGNEEEET